MFFNCLVEELIKHLDFIERLEGKIIKWVAIGDLEEQSNHKKWIDLYVQDLTPSDTQVEDELAKHLLANFYPKILFKFMVLELLQEINQVLFD